MKRYALLLLGVVAVAALLGLLVQRPRREAPPPSPAAAPLVTLEIEVREDGVTPEGWAVPKGHRVRLAIRNAARRPLAVSLAGYERAVSISSLPPDSTWRTEFLADLPGEDFAWLVDGRPVGRLRVTGSHLVEGHR